MNPTVVLMTFGIVMSLYCCILPWIVCIARVFWGDEIIRTRNELKERRIQAEIIDFTVPEWIEKPVFKNGFHSDFYNCMYRKENYYYSVVTYRYGEEEHTGNIYRSKKDYMGRTVDIDIMEDGRICRTASVMESPYLTGWYWGTFIFEPIAAVFMIAFCKWLSMKP